ncbi:hypothetical protein Tco_0322864 [Tanacetum coccineum]
MKILKKPLRKLLHKQGKLHEHVNKLRIELDTVQKALDSDPDNPILREEESVYIKAFNEAKLDESDFLSKKAKVDWLEASNSNSAYFHKSIKCSNHRSRIEVVLNSENIEVSGPYVPEVFVSHYEQFPGTSMACNELNVEGLFSKTVSAISTSNMVREVTNEEIKPAMFDIGRQISDNILITQELMRNYHRNRGPQYVRLRLIFKKRMIRWIGVFWRTFSPDDLFIFARGDLNSACVIMESLDEFKKVSGLVPSIPKSMAYFCNVVYHMKLSILSIIPFSGWLKLLQLRDLVRPFFWVKLGNGSNTSLWFDNWCESCPLIRFLSPRDIAREGFHIQSSVADLVSNGLILGNDVTSMVPCWRFLLQRHGKPLGRENSLKTHDRIRQWDVGVNTSLNLLRCALCDTQPDTHAHLIFECPFSSKVLDRSVSLILGCSLGRLGSLLIATYFSGDYTRRKKEEEEALVGRGKGKVGKWNFDFKIQVCSH